MVVFFHVKRNTTTLCRIWHVEVIKLFRNKKTKKAKLRESEECLKLFNETVGNKIEEEGYGDSLALYNKIKEYYKVKIKQKDFIISVERIRLETIVGKYSDSLSNYSISLFIGIMSALTALFIQSMDVLNINISAFPKEINMLLKVGTFFTLLYILARSLNDSTSIKNRRKSIVNSIRLNVLAEIEKELAQKEANTIDRENIGDEQPEKTQKEVGATKQKSKSNNSIKKKKRK